MEWSEGQSLRPPLVCHTTTGRHFFIFEDAGFGSNTELSRISCTFLLCRYLRKRWSQIKTPFLRTGPHNVRFVFSCVVFVIGIQYLCIHRIICPSSYAFIYFCMYTLPKKVNCPLFHGHVKEKVLNWTFFDMSVKKRSLTFLGRVYVFISYDSFYLQSVIHLFTIFFSCPVIIIVCLVVSVSHFCADPFLYLIRYV